jgi:hypothetical protein
LYNKRIVLFSSKQSRDAFEASPKPFADAAHTAMQQAAGGTTYR